MQLAGVKQITISAPGVLLDQWTPDQLQVRVQAPQAMPSILDRVLSVKCKRIVKYDPSMFTTNISPTRR